MVPFGCALVESCPDNVVLGDAIFGVVEVQTNSLERESLGALWVLRKELAEMHILYPVMMLLQSLPCGPFAERDNSGLRS